jgi:hypothetical protein
VPRVVPGGHYLVATRAGVDRIEWWPDGATVPALVRGLDVVAVAGITTDRVTGSALALVTGFDQPTALHRIEPAPVTGELVAAPWFPTDLGDRPSLAVRQVEYPSADGTMIGLFLVHRHDVEPDRDTAAILNGYGGFAIPETPIWSPTIAAWCAAGGLYAIAGLRGGAEHGEDWHHAGRRGNKQNVFDDFHAAADWLVDAGMTGRDRLAIAGGSNGGLLVGAAVTQRPDLCRAVWCAVPLLDMIRFPNFLIARLWTDEYGDPDVPEEFAWLWATRRTTAFGTGSGIRRCSSPPPRATPVSTRSTRARWRRCSSTPPPTRRRVRSCSTRRAAPATASASRSASAPPNKPTCSPSSPGSWARAVTMRLVGVGVPDAPRGVGDRSGAPSSTTPFRSRTARCCSAARGSSSTARSVRPTSTVCR